MNRNLPCGNNVNQKAEIVRRNRATKLRLITSIVFGTITFLSLILHAGQECCWAVENTNRLQQYLKILGNTFYCVPEVSFHVIAADKKNAHQIWPFDRFEADEKYKKIAKEIMETCFTPVEDFSSNPLKVYMSVQAIKDNNGIAAVIRVDILKPYLVLPWSNPESSNIRDLPIVFWQDDYQYIDDVYLSTKDNRGKYSFAVEIDQHFKESLYRFVAEATRYRKLAE